MDLFLTLGFVVLAAGASVAITTLWLRRRDSQAEADYAASESRVQAAIRDRDMAVEARVTAERGAAAAQAELTAIQTRLEDFERLRKEVTEAAKGAVSETAAQVSSKLLDDHKRESTHAKQQTEERVRQVSETLVKQMAEVALLVKALDKRVDKTGGEMD